MQTTCSITIWKDYKNPNIFHLDHKFKFVHCGGQKLTEFETVQILVTAKQPTFNDHIFQNTEAMSLILASKERY